MWGPDGSGQGYGGGGGAPPYRPGQQAGHQGRFQPGYSPWAERGEPGWAGGPTQGGPPFSQPNGWGAPHQGLTEPGAEQLPAEGSRTRFALMLERALDMVADQPGPDRGQQNGIALGPQGAARSSGGGPTNRKRKKFNKKPGATAAPTLPAPVPSVSAEEKGTDQPELPAEDAAVEAVPAAQQRDAVDADVGVGSQAASTVAAEKIDRESYCAVCWWKSRTAAKPGKEVN